MNLVKKSTQTNSELIEKFNALGDKTRFKLLELLIQDDGICVSELASAIDISNAGVSQQLKVLEQAGILVRERNGQKICYRVDETSASNKELLKLIG